MSKKNGTSWFTAVKRVLWSPSSKDSNKKSIHRTRGGEFEHDHEHLKDTDKKREKRGWMFRKTKLETINSVTDNVAGGMTPTAEIKEEEKPVAVDEETVVKLNTSPSFIRRHWAAIVIQRAFRGYLARRALRALKGIVKLQALVRGNNVRNQAKLTLRCIKALVRVQDQVLHHQRSRVSSSTSILEARRNSMFAESNNSFWDTKTCLQDIRCRRSLSRDMSSCANEWDDRLVNPEDTQTILQRKVEVALKREKAQAIAYSNQIRSRSYRNASAGEETELVERTKWLDRWMATKQWDDTITNSTTCEQYKIKVPIKTLEIDTNITSTHQRFTTVSHSIPATPPSCKAARPVGLRSGSPRVPCSPSVCPRSPLMQPNYMTATESAKARARPQSTPRRRPVGTVKKRLCYADEERGYEYLRSPSFKSAYNGCLWGDHESDYSCCYGGRYAAGEISPSSTSDLRWLK